MAHEDNAAGRLHSLFETFKSHDKQNDKTQYRSALATFLGLDDSNDLPWLLERMALVVRLPAQIRREVALLDFDGTAFLDRLPKFEQVLASVSLNQRVHGSLNPVDAGAMEGMRLCSEILHQARPQTIPTAEQRDALIQEIDSLESTIRSDTELSEDVLEFLLRHLGEMRRAVVSVRIAGPVELQATTIQAYGEWMVRFGSDPPETRSTTKFWTIATKVATLLTLFQALQIGPASPPPTVEIPIHVEVKTDVQTGNDPDEVVEQGDVDVDDLRG